MSRLRVNEVPRSRVVWFALSSLLLPYSGLAQAVQAGPGTGESYSLRLEAVQVSEILILTPRPYDSAQVEDAKRKAEALRDQIKSGGSFSDVAKANSQGPTAATGGNLGTFYHGDLAPSLEELVFHMKVGGVSDVVRTKQGFLILQVTGRAGPDVRGDLPVEVLNAPMTPELQAYLNQMVARIRQRWDLLVPPSARVPEKKQGALTVGFQIRIDGSIAEMKLLSSTGDTALDEAVLQAIRQASPFAPLTNIIKEDHLSLRSRFEYNADRSSKARN